MPIHDAPSSLPASANRPGVRSRFFGPLIAAMLTCASVAAAQPPAASPRLLRAGDIDTLPLQQPGQRIAYGTDSLQFGELRLPADARGERVPIAVILHGGCWIAPFATLRNTAPLADALTAQGIATWNVEYRRSDNPGGGWPGTFRDAADAADYVRVLARLHPIDTTRVVLVGHSAGGQLALWLAGRPSLPAGSALAGGVPLPVRGVLSIGGVVDLEEFAQRSGQGCGRGVGMLLGGPPATLPERVREASPIRRVPTRVRTVHLAGAQDAIAPAAVLESYRAAAQQANDSTAVVVIVPGGHFEPLSPRTPAGDTTIGLILSAVGRSPRRPQPPAMPSLLRTSPNAGFTAPRSGGNVQGRSPSQSGVAP